LPFSDAFFAGVLSPALAWLASTGAVFASPLLAELLLDRPAPLPAFFFVGIWSP
jgi:hypothetical protein